MTRDPLDAPATPDVLRALAAAGVLSDQALERALVAAGVRPDPRTWYRFAHDRLLFVGACLCAAGVVFFVAANWSALHPWARMGLVAGGLLATAIAAGALGLRTVPGQAALLLSGLLFGPLVAIYGQAYQTGADAWELFALWTAVFTAHALLARFGALWVAWLILLHTAAFTFTVQSLPGDFFAGDQAVALAVIAGADAAIVALAHALLSGSEAMILARCAATAGLGLLTGVATFVAATLELEPGQWPGVVALPVAWAAMAALYRRRRPDLFMLSLLAVSVLVIASCGIGHVVFETLDLDEGGLWVMGFLVCFEVWLLTRWLLYWRREHQTLASAAGAAGPGAASEDRGGAP
ncbi:MAG TPA: DUF2157 domain-containing protein [Haliangium sp.]|nr:DUF2157 domain-containing protein [Haliangium sp.]